MHELHDRRMWGGRIRVELSRGRGPGGGGRDRSRSRDRGRRDDRGRDSDRGRGPDMRDVKCFNCNQFGHWVRFFAHKLLLCNLSTYPIFRLVTARRTSTGESATTAAKWGISLEIALILEEMARALGEEEGMHFLNHSVSFVFFRVLPRSLIL